MNYEIKLYCARSQMVVFWRRYFLCGETFKSNGIVILRSRLKRARQKPQCVTARSITTTLLFCLFTVCHAQTTLRFQSKIHENAKTLGDIVQIDDDRHHWSRLSLQSHPMPGERVTKEKVIDWMKPHIGETPINWQGKTSIVVTATTQTPAAMLINKAKMTVLSRLQSQYTKIQLDAISQVPDSAYAINDFKVIFKSQFPIAKRLCVWLVHQTPPQQRIPVWFKVHAYQDVWVTQHPLTSNHLVTQQDFTKTTRDIAGLKTRPATAVAEKMRLTSSLPQGHILLDNQLKSPPLVMAGEHVNIMHRAHQITLTLDAIAMNEGYLGQHITVKNPATQKTFVVRISGAHQAETLS